MFRALAFLVTLLVGGYSSSARAQDRDAALQHYERGRALYQEGRYEDARDELMIALELDPGSAVLLYNLGRVNEELDNYEQAIVYYEAYLGRASLDPSERDRVERTIERLRGASEHSPIAPGRRADAVFWTFVGSGAAMLIGGAVTGSLALRQEARADDFVLGVDGDEEARRLAQDLSRRYALATDVLLAVGGAAVTVGLLLFALRTPRAEAIASRYRLEVSGGGGVVFSLQGTL